MRESEAEPEWRRTQQRFDDDEDGRDEYIQLFRDGVRTWVAKELSWFSARISDGAEELGGQIFRSAQVSARVAAIVRCLNEWETRRGQR